MPSGCPADCHVRCTVANNPLASKWWVTFPSTQADAGAPPQPCTTGEGDADRGRHRNRLVTHLSKALRQRLHAALIVEHCESAGLRRVARGGGSSSNSSHSAGPCRQAPLLVPCNIAERHSLPELQRALRQASQAAPGSLEHWQARQMIKAARKAARREAAERLEQQAKEEPEAFYKAMRHSSAPNTVSQVLQEALLAERLAPPSSPPMPPAEPATHLPPGATFSKETAPPAPGGHPSRSGAAAHAVHEPPVPLAGSGGGSAEGPVPVPPLLLPCPSTLWGPCFPWTRRPRRPWRL